MFRSCHFSILALLILAASASQALAQPEDPPNDAAEQADEDIDHIDDLMRAEPVYYQITFPRAWMIVTPDFILDAFFDMHPNHWSDGQTNFSFGGEFIIRHVESFDLVFSLDWADVRTTDDWWLEGGEEIVDADWGQNSLSIIAADVAINWLTQLDRSWELYYGVGLGVAFFLGDFLKTDIDPNCMERAGVDPYDSFDTSIIRANCIDSNGDPELDPTSSAQEEDRIPPLIPALSFNIGTRFIISEHWPIQFELGYKTMYFYAGFELGYIWD